MFWLCYVFICSYKKCYTAHKRGIILHSYLLITAISPTCTVTLSSVSKVVVVERIDWTSNWMTKWIQWTTFSKVMQNERKMQFTFDTLVKTPITLWFDVLRLVVKLVSFNFLFQGGSKTAKYSKEDIERKKLEAQNRRRQKMAQSQQKHQN